MIARQNRFHGHSSLNYVYRHGAVVRGPLISLRYVRNDHRDTYRLAVVVSKKVSKSAVVRNRIRRRIYEASRLVADGFVEPYDLVVTVFADDLVRLTHEEVRRMVTAQLRQAGVLPRNDGAGDAPSAQ